MGETPVTLLMAGIVAHGLWDMAGYSGFRDFGEGQLLLPTTSFPEILSAGM